MRIGALVALSVAASGGGGTVMAQQDTLAKLTGIVRSARDGRPLSDVLISVKGAFSVTDSTGRFSILRLPAGRYALHLEYAGQHGADDYEISLRSGGSLELSILLDSKVEDLAPIVVEASSTEYALSLAGFYMRKDRGFGRFVTREEIDRRHPANLSMMLSGTGIMMRCVRTQIHCMPVRVSSGRRCAVSVFLDGLRVDDYNIDMIPPEDVLGVEVYRQGSDTPAEFSRFSADCGALVIWTKN